MGVAATIVSWILHEGFWAAFSLPKRANFERVTARGVYKVLYHGRVGTRCCCDRATSNSQFHLEL